MEAMLDAGQFERARDEMAFVTRYQDAKTGMIWHEISQSAGLVDWVGRYPYMYVHVDTTFQYLSALSHYIAATGETAFARANWPAIAKAWAYCASVIDAGSGRIFPKERRGRTNRKSCATTSACPRYGSMRRTASRRSPTVPAIAPKPTTLAMPHRVPARQSLMAAGM